MPIDFLLSAVTTLFVTVDPIGLAPIFVTVTAGMTTPQRRRTALRAVIISAVILAVFAFFGERFLDTLGISIPAFRIAGGLMLLWIGFEMVFEKRTIRKSQSASKAVSDEQVHNVSAFPLAVPLLAGPGTITAVILLSGRASESGDPIVLAALMGLIAAILALCFLIFLLADILNRFIGASIQSILTRLLGVMLAALAVQFLIDGVRAAFAI